MTTTDAHHLTDPAPLRELRERLAYAASAAEDAHAELRVAADHAAGEAFAATEAAEHATDAHGAYLAVLARLTPEATPVPHEVARRRAEDEAEDALAEAERVRDAAERAAVAAGRAQRRHDEARHAHEALAHDAAEADALAEALAVAADALGLRDGWAEGVHTSRASEAFRRLLLALDPAHGTSERARGAAVAALAPPSA